MRRTAADSEFQSGDYINPAVDPVRSPARGSPQSLSVPRPIGELPVVVRKQRASFRSSSRSAVRRAYVTDTGTSAWVRGPSVPRKPWRHSGRSHSRQGFRREVVEPEQSALLRRMTRSATTGVRPVRPEEPLRAGQRRRDRRPKRGPKSDRTNPRSLGHAVERRARARRQQRGRWLMAETIRMLLSIATLLQVA